ncbi:MAG: hypothetical protein JNM84_16705 [Planctomycetes bacterium]|nr:hypothetical protein [Planctomycetota bacterium]
MRTRFSPTLCALAALSSLATAQVPEGWYVFGTFNPSAGQTGLFLAHPRKPGQPTTIANVQGDLRGTGSSCVLYRESDGAILAGERAPVGGSVDLHMIQLDGSDVLFDASFSLGRGGPCCGEVPQMALLPDGRVVVAVTDVDAGPLKNILTTGYGWQGVGIVDTSSGLITPIDIANGALITDVFNALALAPDASKVYLGTYVSGTRGDIWEVPIGGGLATLIASTPAGLSNMAFDASGELMVTTLDATQPLFRVTVSNGAVTPVPLTIGSLNAIASEPTTGGLALATGTNGTPRRSIYWADPNANPTLLSTPGLATPSGIAMRPTPREIGNATSGNASYAFRMPNPTGLPNTGNASYALILDATGNARPGYLVLSSAALTTPLSVYGCDIFVDPTAIALIAAVPQPPVAIPLGIPSDPNLVGLQLFAQSFHAEAPTQLLATAALALTIL